MKLVTYESAKQSHAWEWCKASLWWMWPRRTDLIAKGKIADAKLAAAAEVLRKLGQAARRT